MEVVAATAWVFYGREGCGCCQEAARLLLDLLDGKPVTLRMVDVEGHGHPPGVSELPALASPDGHVVWRGSFDSRATNEAWLDWQVSHPASKRGRAAA